MKTITKALILFYLCLTATTGFAQEARPAKQPLFTKYASSIAVSDETFNHVIKSNSGENISIAFDKDFVFQGTVLSNIKKYDNLQSVIIKSPLFKNSLMQLSKITNDDKSISYVGRIINPDATDGYEIKMENNQYTIQKFELSKILQDCSY